MPQTQKTHNLELLWNNTNLISFHCCHSAHQTRNTSLSKHSSQPLPSQQQHAWLCLQHAPLQLPVHPDHHQQPFLQAQLQVLSSWLLSLVANKSNVTSIFTTAIIVATLSLVGCLPIPYRLPYSNRVLCTWVSSSPSSTSDGRLNFRWGL